MKTPAEMFLDSFAEFIKIDIGEIYDRAKMFFRDLSPDEIYSTEKLLEWHRIHTQIAALKNISLSQARELDPEDVFDFEDLKRWAEENGFERPSRACNCDDSTCTACMDTETDHEG